MADTSNRGLGSDKMDDQTKHDIQSEGGQSGRDSSGQFEEGSPEASEAGRKGGSNS